MPVTEEQRTRVAQLLGREPRGLEAIAVSSPDGQPVVIRVACLVDDKPFPTLFWLVDPALSYRIDGEEARGLIARLQQQIDDDPQLQRDMAVDHRRYIDLRQQFMSPQDRQRVELLGFTGVFEQKGIGGIADFTRIRCLHTWYAAHLVESNVVGRLLDAHWQRSASGDCN